MPRKTGRLAPSAAVPSDRELLDRIATGDESAVHALRARYETTVYALAYGILGDAVDAEHVVAETFLATQWQRRRPLGEEGVPAWLRAAARARSMALLGARQRG